MRVFRVGHEEQTRSDVGVTFPVGPYIVNFPVTASLRLMGWAHRDAEHPSPGWDHALCGIGKHEVCGFLDLGDLLTWFASFHSALDENGFRVWVYDVPESAVRFGSCSGQIVFSAADAVHVETFDIPLGDAQLALF
ncbi:hypothetical protein [Streptomyces sp. 135]|uniref:hypothetical protein n=1 Tax=Streptomyces sp. 135 TaxID=2838850 RepID=UPI001CBC8C0C|nr:hypothetical protein [Streptomyces sp. 135]